MFMRFNDELAEPGTLRVLVGTEADDVLTASRESDVLSAGLGDDLYLFNRSDEAFVTVDDSAFLSPHIHVSGGGHDSIFLLDILREDLVYNRDGSDLILAHVDDLDLDQADYGVRIHRFYGESSDPTGVSSMPPGSGFDPYSEDHTNRIENVITSDFQLIDLQLL